MKVLIDTNVLLDFYCQREDFYQDAANIFDLACRGKIETNFALSTLPYT